ncbi:uncharacterized protein ATNIH1004_003851 [Aspergillus tanneri]|uniref:Uncharacterized protein n=1 Tax=Aspergillus tanneri TaxID=1220188 RepID=A0A5M9MTP8_9EURO|nr:uncharacterized protein ATNIH1004_003851 [Aspergillus tanneri]KAA8647969.1 hypothetical protein ATNIH1004_003851 [Aspergillus tanneri]
MASHARFSPDLALYLISILNVTSVPGRILPPHLGDQLLHFNILTLSAFCTEVSILALWLSFNYYPRTPASLSSVGLWLPIRDLPDSHCRQVRVSTAREEAHIQITGITASHSCLTELPIMGSNLNRQHDTDHSGLQLFAAISILIGTGFLAVFSTFSCRSVNHERVKCAGRNEIGEVVEGRKRQGHLRRYMDSWIPAWRIHDQLLPWANPD